MRLAICLVLILLGVGLLRGQQATQGAVASPSIQTNERPSPDANGVYHKARGVVEPKLISSVEPEFSEKARKKKLSGECVLSIVVDSEGKPRDVKIVRSIAERVAPKLRDAARSLDEKAVEAVRQYKFEPARVDGKAVPFATTVEVSFQIF